MRTMQDVVDEMVAAARDPDPLARHAVNPEYDGYVRRAVGSKARRKRLHPQTIAAMMRMRQSGCSLKQVAAVYCVSRSTVLYHEQRS